LSEDRAPYPMPVCLTASPMAQMEDALTVFKDGPVTGALSEPNGKAPEGTILEGHLWTTGDKIVGRYFRARLQMRAP
jgi:hypothetical protein